jgi:uncharacterized protein DUF3618
MDTGQVYAEPHEPVEVDPEQIERQMRETRARIDRKLDALTARTTRVKARMEERAPWAVLALIGGWAGLVQVGRWMRARRRRRIVRRQRLLDRRAFTRF